MRRDRSPVRIGLCSVQGVAANAEILPFQALVCWICIHLWFLKPELDKGLIATLNIDRESQVC